MTIDKAIEILENLSGEGPYYEPEVLAEAAALGKEALKRIKEHRAEFGDIPYIHLPGETRE